LDNGEHVPSPVIGSSKPRLWNVLGPGLVTGAADDDPSGIATYSQAGAFASLRAVSAFPAWASVFPTFCRSELRVWL
jgi:hypothetical protein